MYDFTEINQEQKVSTVLSEVELYEPWVKVEAFLKGFVYEADLHSLGSVVGPTWFDGGFRFTVEGEQKKAGAIPMWLALCGIKEFKHKIKTEERTYE